MEAQEGGPLAVVRAALVERARAGAAVRRQPVTAALAEGAGWRPGGRLARAAGPGEPPASWAPVLAEGVPAGAREALVVSLQVPVVSQGAAVASAAAAVDMPRAE